MHQQANTSGAIFAEFLDYQELLYEPLATETMASRGHGERRARIQFWGGAAWSSAATLVLAADGTAVPIEAVEAGDTVAAFDPPPAPGTPGGNRPVVVS